MPERSTPFQATVRLVREHFASEGVTVTESKILRDAELGVGREVDIVVEGSFDGDAAVTSIDVNERSRRATLPWVQEMIRKHESLPTNILILVSRAGFTANALRQVALGTGKVRALRPEVIQRDGLPVVNSLYADVIKYEPKHSKVLVRMPSALPAESVDEPGLDVYDNAGAVLGQVGHLVYEALRYTGSGTA